MLNQLRACLYFLTIASEWNRRSRRRAGWRGHAE